MNIIQTKYNKEVLPKLKEEFKIENNHAAPYLEKIVINTGAADVGGNQESLDKIKEQLSVISGQIPRITAAKRAIASFKLRENDPIGVMVTLRGNKAWDFLNKFISIVTPRMRDFRGVPESKFDKFGNYSLGITEQLLFPEIDYAKIDKVRGLVLTIVIKNSDAQKSKRFLELMGLPFKIN